MAAYDNSGTEASIYEEHLSHDEIISGLANGEYKKGIFSVSRENYREANVTVDHNTLTTWFIQVCLPHFLKNSACSGH